MAWTRRDAVVAALLAGLTITLLYRVVPYFRVYKVEVGDRAPEFNITGDDGQGLRLADFSGKFVLLNFWATWCPPCVDEMPSLNLVQERLSGRGLVVLGISVDENKDEYEGFLESANIRFPTGRDPERQASTLFGTVKYPETYLIDRDGIVIRKYIGPEDWSQAEIFNYLSSLL